MMQILILNLPNLTLLQLNGGCVIVNKASGEALAAAANKTAGLSSVMQAIREPIQ